MKLRRLKSMAPVGLSAVALLLAPYAAAQDQSAQAPDEIAARLQLLKQQVDEQTRRLDALKRSVAAQEASLNDMRRPRQRPTPPRRGRRRPRWARRRSGKTSAR